MGQTDIVGEGTVLRKLIESDNIPSIIFWGPPGSGKTTLANIIAKSTRHFCLKMSAVSTTLQDVREVIHKAEQRLRTKGQSTILFLDEIHRFNKLQQDIFLPYVEAGLLILIGATTENPSFSLNNALLSRCQIFHLKPITEADMAVVLQRALDKLSRNPASELGQNGKLYPIDTNVEIDPEEVIKEYRRVTGGNQERKENEEKEKEGSTSSLSSQTDTSSPAPLPSSPLDPSSSSSSTPSPPLFLSCPQCHCVSFSLSPSLSSSIIAKSNGDCRTAIGYLSILISLSSAKYNESCAKLWRETGLDAFVKQWNQKVLLNRLRDRKEKEKEKVLQPSSPKASTPSSSSRSSSSLLSFSSPSSPKPKQKIFAPNRPYTEYEVKQLKDLGFEEKKIRKILKEMTVERAIDWLLTHTEEEEDDDEKEEEKVEQRKEEEEEDRKERKEALEEALLTTSSNPEEKEEEKEKEDEKEIDSLTPISSSSPSPASISSSSSSSSISSTSKAVTCSNPFHPHLSLAPSSSSSILNIPLALSFDQNGSIHTHNSLMLRNSIVAGDENATLYYIARILTSTQDYRLIEQILLQVAVEEVGLADPFALVLTVSCCDTMERLGLPEGDAALAQSALYMCRAKKDKSSAVAMQRAKEYCLSHPPEQVPLHIRNAVTDLMTKEGYAEGQIYPPQEDPMVNVKRNYLPPIMTKERIDFFEDVGRGVKEWDEYEEVEDGDEGNAEEGKDGKEGGSKKKTRKLKKNPMAGTGGETLPIRIPTPTSEWFTPDILP